VTKANELALRNNPDALLPLDILARLIQVHVRTLHKAAKDGRLHVTYNTRTTFRRLRSRATLADAERFRRDFFEKAPWPSTKPMPLQWQAIPVDYSERIRSVRRQVGLTQTEFAAHIGAAGKAVVYQWEAQKRCPSPVFWQRICQIEKTDYLSPRTAGKKGDPITLGFRRKGL
jgi:ribosome-binding protein aMBF1 (putative translation factor)